MNHGSLFNGIGGFQLAAAWMGWTNLFSCEIDNFCNQVTKKHFPDCIQHGDIRETDFTIYRGDIDILTGGFPCQPFSVAGKRKGTEDERFLWGEMLRAIKEVSPRYVVAENVPGLLSLSGGLVFEQVCADLENAGYEVQPVIIPACAVNAPHRRDRVWFIAKSRDERCDNRSDNRQERYLQGNKRTASKSESERQGRERWIRAAGSVNTYANCEPVKTQTDRRQINIKERSEIRNLNRAMGDTATSYSQYERCKEQWDKGEFRSSPTVPSVRGRVEPGFRGGDDGFSSRVDRIKALGNAIVPQIAFELFKAIEQTQHLNSLAQERK